MEEDHALRRGDGVLWRQALRGLLLLVPGSDDPLLITPPGDAIWTLLAEPHTRIELVDALAAAFDEDPRRISDDIAPVLETLLAEGAVSQEPATSPGDG